MKRSTTSEKIGATFTLLRDRNQWPNGTAPYGTKIVTCPDGKKRLVWDDKASAMMGEIVLLHDEEGKSFAEISVIMKPVFKKVRPRMFMHRLYRREKAIRELGVWNPGELQFGKFQQQFESAVLSGYRIPRDQPINPDSAT